MTEKNINEKVSELFKSGQLMADTVERKPFARYKPFTTSNQEVEDEFGALKDNIKAMDDEHFKLYAHVMSKMAGDTAYEMTMQGLEQMREKLKENESC